jgi:hypothetical protein
MQGKTKIEFDAEGKSFATGLLPELILALRQCAPGDLLAVSSSTRIRDYGSGLNE